MLDVARKRVDLRLPEELIEAVDRARGDVTRTRFIERALEEKLAVLDVGTSGRPAGQQAPAPASPRASEHDDPQQHRDMHRAWSKPFNPIPKGDA